MYINDENITVCHCFWQVTQGTNQIVMNCADIDIITASFVPEGGEGQLKNNDFFSALLADCWFNLHLMRFSGFWLLGLTVLILSLFI